MTAEIIPMNSTDQDNWVSRFMEYTDGIPSPEIYRIWSAYTILAGALERRVWTRLTGSPVYPNLITLLVGPPGSGKTQVVKEARDLWDATGKFNVAPSGMTKAAFVDQLGIKARNFQYKNTTSIYNPMLIAATEFGTLLPEYDIRFLNTVNDVYDCLPIFEDSTRGGGRITVLKPHICALAGTQPKYLGQIIPETAYGMGFMSRLLMIYSGQRVVVSLFSKKVRSINLRKELVKALVAISKMCGEFEWELSAQQAVEKWNSDLFLDAPKHPRLLDYGNRRAIHAIKLAMTFSAARGPSLIVTLEDFSNAKKMLLLAEKNMPEIFKEMRSSEDASEVGEIHRFVFNYCRRRKCDSIEEHVLTHFMLQRVPVHRVTFFIEMMVTSRMLEVGGLNIEGRRTFSPVDLLPYGQESEE